MDINGQYERGTYAHAFPINAYQVQAEYILDNYWANGTLNINLLTLGQRIFLDVGIGPTTGLRFIKQVTRYTYALRSPDAEDPQGKRLPVTDSLANAREPIGHEGVQRDKWLVGVNAPLTLEIYLSRHFSILGKYRVKYLLRSSTDRFSFDSTIGASIHF